MIYLSEYHIQKRINECKNCEFLHYKSKTCKKTYFPIENIISVGRIPCLLNKFDKITKEDCLYDLNYKSLDLINEFIIFINKESLYKNNEKDIYKPFESWVFYDNKWNPPFPLPDISLYYWNEEIKNWTKIDFY